MRIVPRLVAVALLGVAWLAIPANPGYADEVAGGRLDWGVKASFRQYVTGPIAQGDVAVTSGATTTGDGRFRFHSATGDYRPGGGAYRASYSGGVRFTGHRRDDGSYELDLTIANPTVEVGGGAGTLYADVTSGGSTRRQVRFANLAISEVDISGTGTAAASGVAATLTAQGAEAFAGYYAAGEQLDPVAFTGDVVPTQVAPEPEPSDDPEPDGTVGRAFTGAIVDWGVRRTFREYVTGEIAQGTWQLADGAAEGGPVFRFTGGEGSFDAAGGVLKASFRGAVSFTGNGVDLMLRRPSVRIAGGEGTLSAEVATASAAPERVALVSFPAVDLEPAGGLLLIEAAPATLTGGGAAVFNGFYDEGTEMDPVTVAVPLADGAEVPPLPDIGREPLAPATPSTPTAPASPAAAAAGGGTGPELSTLVLVVVGLVALAAGALVLLRRRWRGATDPDTTRLD